MGKHIIACKIFQNILTELMEKYQLEYSIDYLDIEGHNRPEQLKKDIQELIDRQEHAEKIILFYGICGNALKGVRSRNIPLVIPRTHDCCQVLLGGKNRYKELFAHRPSQGWACHSYEKIEEQTDLKTLIELYGEDNGQYLYDNLYHKEESLVYISFNNPVDAEKIDYYRTLFGDRLEIETGSAAVLKKLLLGEIDDETLVVPPHHEIELLYDDTEVMSVKKF